MARLITEPFDALDALFLTVNGGQLIQTSLTPLDQGYYLNTSNNSSGYLSLPSSPTEIYCGFFLNPNIPLSSIGTPNLFSIGSGATTQASLRYNTSSNKFEMVVNSLVVGAPTTTIPLTTTFHIQIRYKLAAAGIFEMKINNQSEVITYNGNTIVGAGTKLDRYTFHASDGGSHFDSFYLNDTSGTVNNGYDGILRMKPLVMASDSALSGANQWSRSTGGPDGWSIVDNAPYLVTENVFSVVNSQYQFFVPTAHGLTAPAIIHAVSARHVARKISEGEFEPNFAVNGGAYPSAIQQLGVAYSVLYDRRTVNPATSAAWQLTEPFELGMRSVLP